MAFLGEARKVRSQERAVQGGVGGSQTRDRHLVCM